MEGFPLVGVNFFLEKLEGKTEEMSEAPANFPQCGRKVGFYCFVSNAQFGGNLFL